MNGFTKMKALGEVANVPGLTGKFSKDETFWVNDEQRATLVRINAAVVDEDQSLPEPEQQQDQRAASAPVHRSYE